jgi:TonB family protein
LSATTLPSGQEHHFRERAFKRSFFVSFGIHVVILVAAGSMTLFRMSGTIYAPSYTVDLVSVPAPTPAASAKPAASRPRTQSKPAPENKVQKPAESAPPKEIREEIQQSGGDEAARLERRKKREELEMEIGRLLESFTSEENTVTEDRVGPAQTSAVGPSVTDAPTGGNDVPSNIMFRAYHDRIWAKIRSSWVPQGVTSEISLIAVVGIRIAVDGEIEQFWIEERSGNDYYDQSAIRAIRKANPLPPLPDDMNDEPLDVGINFRYPE